MPVRLNRFLASAGIGSRRAVEQMIRAGRVTVNGEVGQLTTTVEPEDDIRVDGQPVAPEPLVHVMLHKPAGVVTTAHDPQGRRTVLDLVDGVDQRIYPVGRLDRDTTGLLILTNDGALADRLMHPRGGVGKTYVARVERDPAEEPLARLRAGIELEDGPTAPAAVRRVAPGVVEITIHQGRNRQVRRMFEAVGHPVRTLHRVRYGPLVLGDLPPGGWRRLDQAEVEALHAG